MALINVLDIRFLNNPAPISAPYEIEIQFECLESLAHDLEWKLIYVGSGFPNDVELDSLLVGPIPTGVNKFVFTADPIDVSQIPSQDVLGVSVILLTASYDDREFVRVGFYNNNEYTDSELRSKYDTLLSDGTDEERAAWKFEGVKNVDVQRNILTAKPRVTRFNIKWDNENFNDEPPEQEEPEGDGDVVTLEDLGEGEDEDEGEGEEEEEEEQGEQEQQETEGASIAADDTTTKTLGKDDDGDEQMVAEEDDDEEDLGSGSENDNDNENDGEGEAEGEPDLEIDESEDDDDEVEGIEVDNDDAPGPSK